MIDRRADSRFGRLVRGGLVVLAVLAASVAFAQPSQAQHWHGHGGVTFGFGLNLYAPAYPYGYPYPYYYAPYYYPPAYYPPPAVVAPPVQPQANCQQGSWRYPDGTVVNGVACQRPDGTWQMVR